MRIELAAYVMSDKDLAGEGRDCYRAELTDASLKKVNA